MIILGLTPHNEFTGKTPEEAQLRKLRDFGHTVYIRETCHTLPDKKINIIASMSEVTAENAYILSNKFNIPFYAHMEWIPEWRIFRDSEFNWGYISPIPYSIKMNFIRMYQRYVYFWGLANVKTLAAKCFNKSMEEFIGGPTKIDTKHIGINVDKLKEFKKKIKKDNSIVCIARFVPHKRLLHIIKALQIIEFKGILKLVGYGAEQINYELLSDGINIEFINSKDKYKALKSASLCIALWSGIVPAEAAYMGIPTITYESKYMRELYDDTLLYVKNNSIMDLAKMIGVILMMNKSAREDIANYCVYRIENKEIDILTLDESVLKLEKLLKEAIKK